MHFIQYNKYNTRIGTAQNKTGKIKKIPKPQFGRTYLG